MNLSLAIQGDTMPKPLALPVLSDITPSVGSLLGNLLGGLLVTLTGTNLSAVTTVTIGGVQALAVVAVNDTTVTAITPTLTLGVKAVVASNASGSSNALTFTVNA